jgi:hypothetical protein
MKKHILGLALVVAMVGAMASSCGSTKKTDGSDSSAMKDSTKMTDTTKKADSAKMMDTTKKDTTKK